MTSKPKEADESDADDGKGCLFVIGLVIIAIVLGNLYGPLVGWLTIGIGFVLVAVM